MESAADDRRHAELVGARELAERIQDDDVFTALRGAADVLGERTGLGAPEARAEVARLEGAERCGGAIQMARGDDEERMHIRGAPLELGERPGEERFVAVARAPRDEHRPAADPCGRRGWRIPRHRVELARSEDHHGFGPGADRDETPAVAVRLRGDPRESRHCRAEERGQRPIATHAPRREPAVHHQHRHAAERCGSQESGPELGLRDQDGMRIERVER